MAVKADQIRSMTNKKLYEEQHNTQRELLNIRFRLATRQSANAGALKDAKRRLAQIKTIIRERMSAGGTS
jgi:ribosomal protein L29